MGNTQRETYFDFLRGIAIIMVVGIHTVSGLGFDTIHQEITVFIRQILNCAVPIFLAISGYFLAKKEFGSKKDFFRFFRKQSKKVYIPTLIWSLPWLGLALLSGENVPFTILSFFCCGMSIFYFIALIIQYYSLLPILGKIKWGGVIVCVLISCVSIAWISKMLCEDGISLPLIIYAGPFPVWIMFFAIGCFLGRRVNDYSISLFVGLTVVFLCMGYIETRYLYQFHGSGFGIKLSSFLYSLFMILVLFSDKVKNSFKINRFSNYIVILGNLSFAIYLSHLLVGMVLHRLLPPIWGVQWILTLLIDTILILFAKRFFNQKVLTYAGL